MQTLTCRAVLFDLDGTLIDSTAAVDRAWTKWSLSHGLDPAQVLPMIHGRRAHDSVRLVAPHLDADMETALLEHMEATDTEGVVAVAGAIDLIRQIPAGRWGIVTSGTPPVACARLEAAGIPKPEAFVTADMIRNGKPAPDSYVKGAELLGVASQECLAFEDAAAGIRAAKSAGMTVLGIASPYAGADLSEAEAILPDFTYIKCELTNDGLLSFHSIHRP